MLSSEEQLSVEQAMRICWIIWAAMFVSLVFYVVICHMLEKDLRAVVEIGDMYAILLNALFVISLIEVVIIRLLRKTMLESPSLAANTLLSAVPQPISAPARYQAALITSLALAESIGIYGLILFLLGGDYPTLYVFTAVGGATMIIYRPKQEEFNALILLMKGNMGRKLTVG